MDELNCITISTRCKYEHLTVVERGKIEVLHNVQHKSNRYIARVLNCSPQTVCNELKRGTLNKASSRSRPSIYSAKRAEKVYKANRQSTKRHYRLEVSTEFVEWAVQKMKDDKWLPEALYGYAKKNKLFEQSKMVCAKTLYNYIYKGLLSISKLDLSEASGCRKSKIHRLRVNKR